MTISARSAVFTAIIITLNFKGLYCLYSNCLVKPFRGQFLCQLKNAGDDDFGPGSRFPIENPSTSASEDYIESLKRPSVESLEPVIVDRYERDRALQAALERQSKLLAESGVEKFRQGEGSGGSKLANLMSRVQGMGIPVSAPRQNEYIPPQPIDQSQQQKRISVPEDAPIPVEKQNNVESGVNRFFSDPESDPSGPMGDRVRRLMEMRNSSTQRYPETTPLSPRELINPDLEPNRPYGNSELSDAREKMSRVAGNEERPPAQTRSGRPRMSREEKDRILKETIERQQRLMAKAKGIDTDNADPAEMAVERARVRQMMEAKMNTVMPSTAAADDYMNSLKAHSKKMHEEQVEQLFEKANPYSYAKPEFEGNSAENYIQSLKRGRDTEDLVNVPNQYSYAKPDNYRSNSADDYMEGLKSNTNEFSRMQEIEREKSEESIADIEPISKILSSKGIGMSSFEIEDRIPSQIYSKSQQVSMESQNKKLSYAERLNLAKKTEVSSENEPKLGPETADSDPGQVSYALQLQELILLQQAKMKNSKMENSPSLFPQPITKKSNEIANKGLQDMDGNTEPPPKSQTDSSDINKLLTSVLDLMNEQVKYGKAIGLRKALIEVKEALKDEVAEKSVPIGQNVVEKQTKTIDSTRDVSPTSEFKSAADMLKEHEKQPFTGVRLMVLRKALLKVIEAIDTDLNKQIEDINFSDTKPKKLDEPLEKSDEPSKKSTSWVAKTESNSQVKSVGSKTVGLLLKLRGGPGLGRGGLNLTDLGSLVESLDLLVRLFQNDI